MLGAFLAINLLSCKNDAASVGENSTHAEPNQKAISKIEITEFGKTTSLTMKYNKNVISIEFQPYEGNVESRIELNKNKQIQEVISGTQRIQYLYDESGRKIGIISGNGMQQIMFDYQGQNISAQHTIVGNDTVVSHFYQYQNGQPTGVQVIARGFENRTYRLEYSNTNNALTGFNEMILPTEISALLGIPATYGKKYLKKAIRSDNQANIQKPLNEQYVPQFDVVEFEITKTGKQETLNLVSDGSRQWNAVIHW